MSTSFHDGIKPIAGAHYGGDDDPVGAVIWRDGIANGLLHCADSYAQVRVALSFPDTSSFSSGAPEYIAGTATPTADAWYRIGAPFGPWPLTLHADGTPYRLRVRIAMAASAPDDSLAVRVVIAPETFGAAHRDLEADHIYHATFGSTTPAWLTGATRGVLASETMLTVTQEVASGWMRDAQAYDAVSAATPHTIQQCLVCAHVFFQSFEGDATAHLHALHIAEYVGT